MKKSIENTLEKVVKITKDTLKVGAVGVLGGYLIANGINLILDKTTLTPEFFEGVNWIEIYNPEGTVDDKLKYEKGRINGKVIPVGDQFSKGLYTEKVTERNNGKLTGYVELPDLNGDGSVGPQSK